jgi:hypothetical protein
MRLLFSSIRSYIKPKSPRVSVMPDRLSSNALLSPVATVRLRGLNVLVIAIISIIVVGGVLIVRTPLVGWAA